jgi:BUD22
MPKRKRNPDSPSRVDRTLDIRIARLKVRIEQGILQLKKALNLARGFERQKLGRRQKAATKEPQILLRLREEVIILKQLDLGIVAERQFFKRLGKVKRIAENSAYALVYGDKDVKGPKNDAEANVVGRLMNSNPVKECLPRTIESIFGVLGIENNGLASKTEKLNDKKAPTNGTLGSSEAQTNQLTRAEDDEWSGSESGSDIDVPMDDGDLEDSMDDPSPVDFEESHHNKASAGGTDFSGFSDRIADSSEDKSEEDDSDKEVAAKKGLSSHERSRRHPVPETSHTFTVGSPSPSPSPSESPKRQKKKTATRPPPSSTASLPALTMGGYYSGSESASDIEDDRTKVRKNRRGQRERQKIAEAKFGAAAKHLAKQDGNRNAGWDPKRGATDGKANSKGRMRFGKLTNTKGPTGANGDVLGSRKREIVKDGPMHPSWEAARKRKEQSSKIAINPASGMGKKITFD